jgi:hypothetical protein
MTAVKNPRWLDRTLPRLGPERAASDGKGVTTLEDRKEQT